MNEQWEQLASGGSQGYNLARNVGSGAELFGANQVEPLGASSFGDADAVVVDDLGASARRLWHAAGGRRADR
jgi:hypothetical protein